VLPFGLYVRRTLPETFEAKPAHVRTSWSDIRSHAGAIAFGFFMLASATTATYTLNNMTNYATVFLHMRVDVSFAATLVLGVTTFVFSMPSGIWSDRFGRRPVMIWPRVALLLVTWPLFAMLANHRDAPWLLGATFAITLLNALSTGAAFASLAEALPKELRSGVLSTVYAVSIALFGGTTQLAETWLIHASNNVLAPAWYLMGATVIGVIAMALMPETAPVRRMPR
jgi:MFS family permease